MIQEDRLQVFIDTLNWKLPDDLAKLEEKALEQEVPIIRRPTQTTLGFLLRQRKPHRVLEIGTAVGFSSLWMSRNMEPEAKIITIEKVPARIQAAHSHFQKMDLRHQITLMPGEAKTCLQELCHEKQKFDFIFMDAAKGQYEAFLTDIMELLSSQGMLVTDNVFQEGDILESRFAVTRRDRTIHSRMRSYLYRLTHTSFLDTLLLPVGDGLALTTFSVNALAEEKKASFTDAEKE